MRESRVIQRVLVTGGAGFIGSNFIQMLLRERPQWRVVCLDKLTYAGNMANLETCFEHEHFRFVRGDICDPTVVEETLAQGIDAVVNFAAESHVDRSILGCQEFVHTNVQGVQVLLDAARQGDVELFLQVSTDEVYGSLGAQGRFTETTPLAPNSPYSASKAAADLLVRAYHHTYGFAGIITRCSNNYGPYQFPEKLIPLFVTHLLADKKVPVYGDGLNVRDWIHVEDHCRAILAVMEYGQAGRIYNVGADNERTNLDITMMLLELLGKDDSYLEYVTDRLGHDRRYAIDSSLVQAETPWRPRWDFAEGLAATVAWYKEHEPWWSGIKTGAYRHYYEQQYGRKL